MGLKNLPTAAPEQLASLLTNRPGQVSSMALAQLGNIVAITLMAFAEGESVSEEAYEGDTLYYVLEGAADVVFAERRERLGTGAALMVPKGQLHAVEAAEAFKMLQICVP